MKRNKRKIQAKDTKIFENMGRARRHTFRNKVFKEVGIQNT
jgi:hypothetical protein